MPVRRIVRGALGPLPGTPSGGPNFNSIRVDPTTDTLRFGTGTSGSVEKIAADNTTSGQGFVTPIVEAATAAAAVQGGALSATTILKNVTAIADATGTAVLTVTVPNAAQGATIVVTLTAALGAGGAIGAFEVVNTAYGQIVIARTAGVATVATAAALTSAATSPVAGATTMTLAYAVSAISGAVGATQTFTINVTITKGGGASANHSCFVEAVVYNTNASGVTAA